MHQSPQEQPAIQRERHIAVSESSAETINAIGIDTSTITVNKTTASENINVVSIDSHTTPQDLQRVAQTAKAAVTLAASHEQPSSVQSPQSTPNRDVILNSDAAKIIIQNCSTQSIEATIELYVKEINLRIIRTQSDNSPEIHRHILNIPNKNPQMVNRPALIQQLNTQLQKSPLVACVGLAGVGKRSLAIAYIYNHLEDYHNIFWFDADEDHSLENSYIKLAKNLAFDFTTSKQAIESVRGWLVKQPHCLVILNNARSYAAVEKYLPRSGAKVLITSQTNLWPSIVNIDVFTPEQSLICLKNCLGTRETDTDAQLNKLSEFCGYLPLALAQSAEFIRITNIPITRFFDYYRQSPTRILAGGDTKILPLDYHGKPLLTAWNTAQQEIQTVCPIAIQLLNICAWLDHTSISRVFIAHLANDSYFNPRQTIIGEALGILQRYFFLVENSETSTFKCHALISDTVWLKQTPDEKLHIVKIIHQMFQTLFNTNEFTPDHEALISCLERYSYRLEQWKTTLQDEENERTTTDYLVPALQLLDKYHNATAKKNAPQAATNKDRLHKYQTPTLASQPRPLKRSNYYRLLQETLIAQSSEALADNWGADAHLIHYLNARLQHNPTVAINTYVWNVTSKEISAQLENTEFPLVSCLQNFIFKLEIKKFIVPVLFNQEHYIAIILARSQPSERFQILYFDPHAAGQSVSSVDKEMLNKIMEEISDTLITTINRLRFCRSNKPFHDYQGGQISIEQIRLIKDSYREELVLKHLQLINVSDKQQINDTDSLYIVGKTITELASDQLPSIHRFDHRYPQTSIEAIARCRAEFCAEEIVGKENAENELRHQWVYRLCKAITSNDQYAHEIVEFIKSVPDESKEFDTRIMAVLKPLALRIDQAKGLDSFSGIRLVDKAINYLLNSPILKQINREELKDFCERLLEIFSPDQDEVIFQLNRKYKAALSLPTIPSTSPGAIVPTVTQVVSKTATTNDKQNSFPGNDHILNVSGFENNCGLFALALGVKKALTHRNLKLDNSSLEFLHYVPDASFQNVTNETANIAKLLREAICAALTQDKDFKHKQLENFVTCCAIYLNTQKLDGLPADAHALSNPNKPHLNALLEMWKTIAKQLQSFQLDERLAYINAQTLDANEIRQLHRNCLMALSTIPDNYNEDRFSDVFEKINTGDLKNIDNIVKLKKLYLCAWDQIQEGHASQRQLFNEAANRYFIKQYNNIISKDLNSRQYFEQLLAFALLESIACNQDGRIKNQPKLENVTANAMSLFARQYVTTRWETIYKAYCSYIENAEVMLTADELGCLASYWQVQLKIKFTDGQEFKTEDNNDRYLISCTLCNLDNLHWQVVSTEVVDSQSVNEKRKTSRQKQKAALSQLQSSQEFSQLPRLATIPSQIMTDEKPSSKIIMVDPAEFDKLSPQIHLHGDQAGKKINALISRSVGKLTVLKTKAVSATEAQEYLTRLWNVPQRNVNFTGRNKLIDEINLRLHQSSSDKISPVIITALNGLGGVGKTQLVIEYIYRQFEKYEMVCWIPAENTSQIEAAFLELANDLQLPLPDNIKPEEIVHIMKTYLSNKKCLLIYDNALDYKTIEKYLPYKQSDVLITSRHREWLEKGIEVDVFSLEEAREFIEKILGTTNSEVLPTIDKLIEALGRLPLALAQAAAYIKHNNMKPQEYLDLYEKKRAHVLLSETLPIGNHHAAVYVTWDITMQKIREESALADKLLKLFSYLYQERIPRNLIQCLASVEEINVKKELYDEAIGKLASYSMIDTSTDLNFVSIHLLLKEIIQLKLSDNEIKNDAALLCEIFRSIWRQLGNDLAGNTEMRRLLPHYESLTTIVKSIIDKERNAEAIKEFKDAFLLLLVILGSKHHDVSNFKKSVHFYTCALEELKLTPDNKMYINVLNNLGMVHGNIGNYKDKEHYLLQALEAEKTRHGGTSIQVARVLENLASVYGELGDHRKRIDILEKALRIKIALYGEKHQLTAQTIMELGNAHGAMGNYLKQKDLLEVALEIRKQKLDANNSKLNKIYTNLGNVHSRLNQQQEAKKFFELALKMKIELYGENHIETMPCLMGLASVFQMSKDHEMAKKYYLKAFDLIKETKGEQNYEAIALYQNLANVCDDLSEVDQKLYYLEKAARIYDSSHNPDNSIWEILFMHLAYTCLNLKEHEKAEAAFKKLLKINISNYGKNSEEVARTLLHLVGISGVLDDYNQQEEYLKDLLELLNVVFEEHSDKTKEYLTKLVTVFSQFAKVEYDLDQKKNYLTHALRLNARVNGDKHKSQIEILESLTRTSFSLKDFPATQQHLEQTLSLQQEILGNRDPAVLKTLELLLFIYGLTKDDAKKDQCTQQIITVKESLYGKNSKQSFEVINHDLIKEFFMVTHRDGEEDLKKQLYTLKKVYGENHGKVALKLIEIADFHGSYGFIQNRFDYLQRALDLIRTLETAVSLTQYVIMIDLAKVCVALQKHDLSKSYFVEALSAIKHIHKDDPSALDKALVEVIVEIENLGAESIKILYLKEREKIKASLLTPDDLEVGKIFVDLGVAYGNTGDAALKKDYLERALEIMRKDYENNKELIATVLNNLGNTFGALGNQERKILLLEESISIRRGLFGNMHHEVGTALLNLANAYLMQKNFPRAQECFEESLAILQTTRGEDHIEYATALANYSNLFSFSEDYEQAIPLLEKSIKVFISEYGEHHPKTAGTMINLSLAYLHLAKIELALSYAEKAYQNLLSHPDCGENHSHTKRAWKLLQQIRSIQQSLPPSYTSIDQLKQHAARNPNDSNALEQLAAHYFSENDLANAMKYYDAVIRLSPDNYSAHHSYACLCHINDNYVEAERHFAQALKIGMHSSTFCDFALLFLRQKKHLLAIEKLLAAVLHNSDDSGLSYGMLESKLLDKYLRQECTKESSLTVKPYFIAHYWLFQCFHLLKDVELATFCLSQLSALCQKIPSALHYRILGYAYTIAGKNDKADECKRLASSHSLPTLMSEAQQKDIVNSLNHQQTYLSHIQELAEHTPTALRLNTLICIYRLLDMEDRIVEVEAQALSLDIDLQMNVPNSASSNTTQPRLGELTYNPSLFNNAQQTQRPADNQATNRDAPASKDDGKGPQKPPL